MPALVTPLHSGRFPFPIDFSLVRTIGIFFSFHNRLHSRSWLTASHRNHVNSTMFPKQVTVLSVKLLAMLYHKVVATKLQHPGNSDRTEGFDTLELQEARALLKELAPES